MKKLIYISIVSLLMLIIGLTVFGQVKRSQSTSDKIIEEMTQSDVKITKEFGSEGQICKIRLEPDSLLKPENVSDLSAEAVENLISQEVSIESRGRKINGVTFSAGCTSIELEDYENVSIGRTFICTQKKGPVSAQIRWKKENCKVEAKQKASQYSSEGKVNWWAQYHLADTIERFSFRRNDS